MEDHHGIIGQVQELTGGGFCDRVIEAVGKQWPLDLAAELTRERGAHRGRLPPGRSANGRHVAVELARPRRDQRPRAGSRNLHPGHARGGRRRRLGRLDPRPLCTNTFPLERLGDALDATRDRPEGFLKALVTP